MLVKNLTIEPFQINKKENHKYGERQLFFLLHEFAMRICYRYSSIEDDPTIPFYNGFARLFQTKKEFNYSSENEIEPAFRNSFRDILIDSCIEHGKHNSKQMDRNLPGSINQYLQANKRERLETLPAKLVIDVLRSLSFPYRTVFNLSVIDGYIYENISSKLQIPVSSVEYNLKKAREELNKLIHPLTINITGNI